MKRSRCLLSGLLLTCWCLAAFVWRAFPEYPSTREEKPSQAELAGQLRSLDGKVFAAELDKAKELGQMLARDARSRMQAANHRENQAWQSVKTRADWERYRDARLQALRTSLGAFPSPPRPLHVRVTRELQGDGYRIENLVFESRPGLVVTANLYRPAQPSAPLTLPSPPAAGGEGIRLEPSPPAAGGEGRVRGMPGILISHSHHSPKTQGELQDMGMTWARNGCLVLVMDHLGHGERRQHPFRSEKDYPHPFRVGRQDYYFRYTTGLQLHLAGESLMGWMVWDLMRGVDLLLSRPGIDKDRIILLGSVAGGGDPAGVTAALDPRIATVAPFNFGGPQPDYPIPPDAERDFYYFGVPGWESTRSLRLSARDGFAHWLIVAAAAPRRLIYAHEFAWDRERDPVWPRQQKVFDWYGVPDHLAVATGQGTLRGKPPESSHCTNIGPLHRRPIHAALKHWFDLPIPEELSQHRNAEELLCLTPEAIREFQPRLVHQLVADLGAGPVATARQRLTALGAKERRQRLREDWSRLLGDVEPASAPRLRDLREQQLANLTVERLALEVEPGIVIPMMLLIPAHQSGTRLPVVLGIAQAGKEAVLRQRSEELAHLLQDGVAVCLPDVRGTGETRPAGATRRHNGADTTISVTETLLGQTLLGARLRDVRSILGYLRSRTDVDGTRLALWGDSFTSPNPKDFNPAVPLEVDPFPAQAEPLGGLLALLGALFEEEIRAVSIQGGLLSYLSLLESPFCYVPHDGVVPGVFKAGDLCDLAAGIAPCGLRLENLVDGLNRRVPSDRVARTFEPVRTAYRSLQAASRLWLEGEETTKDSAARWLVSQLVAH